jgi:hypothetical protein
MEEMMRNLAWLSCLGLLAAGCTDERPVAATASDEAQLSAALAGYEQSGPPLSCVNLRDLRGNRSVGEAAIIFEGPTSATLYVNRPAGGCPDLGFGRALVTRTTSTRLCRGDIATVYDVATRTNYGGCGLGDFLPYRRVERQQ